MFLEMDPLTRNYDSFEAKIGDGPPPKHSYLYGSNGDYLFPNLEQLKEFSLSPPLTIRNVEVIFTFNQGPALYCSHSFIYSLEEFLRLLNLSQNDISQDEKNQIESHLQSRKIKQI